MNDDVSLGMAVVVLEALHVPRPSGRPIARGSTRGGPMTMLAVLEAQRLGWLTDVEIDFDADLYRARLTDAGEAELQSYHRAVADIVAEVMIEKKRSGEDS
jgi:hypothetical protein